MPVTRPEIIAAAPATCPECGAPGRPVNVTCTDGTRIYKCPDCTRIGIGIGDVPYEYPLCFDKEGRKYV